MHSVEEIELGPLRFAGLAARVRNDDPEGIGAHWGRFNSDQTVGRIAGIANRNVCAVYTDYESDYMGAYTMVLGYRLTADATIPAGLRVVEMPRQTFGVGLAQGEQPAALMTAWQWVWASRLRRAYTVDFDEYLTAVDVRLHIALRA